MTARVQPLSQLARPGVVLAVVVTAASLLGVYALVDLPLASHLVLASALMAFGYWIGTRAPDFRLALAYVSVAVSLRYIVWRGWYTLGVSTSADRVLAYALFAAEVYGIFVLVAGYFQTAVQRPRRPKPLPLDPDQLPWVDVLIPTYDEPIDVVRRTLVGAVGMRYVNKTVHLLDDGRRPAMRMLAESIGAVYHTRPDNAHAKAGNINAALRKVRGELVAIFDCDHVPVRSFLDVTVGEFLADQRVALVQTPHHFYNPDPFERNLWLEGRVPPEQQVFYHAVQIGNDFWNSVLFCGSCAVLRRSALDEIGGIAQETVTEDAHTSLRLAAAGWRSAYLDIPLAAGLATERYAHHVAQRVRWARGMTQILRLDNPLWKRGLTLAQRINYLNAIQHFQFGLPRLIFLLAPVAYLVFGLHPLAANPWDVLAYAIPHVFLSVIGSLAVSRSMRHAFWAEVYEAALAPFGTVVTLLTLASPKRGKFNVTVKGTKLARARFDLRHAFPNLVILGLAVAGLVLAPQRMHDHPLEATTLAITAAFNLYNLLVLLPAVVVAFERPQARSTHRVRRSFEARITYGDGLVVTGRTVDLSEDGVGLVLPGGLPVPAGARLTLLGPWGFTRPLRIRPMSSREEGDLLYVGASFIDLPEPDRRSLILLMFGEPDSWVVRGSPNHPLASLAEVARTPWRAVVSTIRRNSSLEAS